MLGERIAEARKKAGLNQAELAAALGDRYDYSMISHVEANRKLLRLDGIVRAAQELNVSLDYLLGLTDDRTSAADRSSVSQDIEFVPIETEMALADFNSESTVLPAEGSYPFRRKRLIEGEGIDPKQARVFRVKGNSMYPALPKGSVILVDYQRRALAEHRIYVYRTNDAVHVKRAKQCPAGEWWWCSDNPTGGKTRRKEADVVQGEVRWVGHGLNHEVSYGV